LTLFIILGVVVLLTLALLGFLFFMLAKEGQKKEEEQAVPVRDLEQLKQELTSHLFEQNDQKVIEKDSEIIPVFQPKMIIPANEVKPTPSPEDDAYKKRARQLEDELLSISHQAIGQSEEARRMIETLTEENESLKRQKVDMDQAQEKLTVLQGEASLLKTENVSLQTQLESTNAKVHFLEEEMAAVKIQMGEEISRANATVAELTREKESFISAPKIEPDQALRQEIEALNARHAELKQKFEDMERSQQKLHELNGDLIEKNEALKYELIKARAQSSGLERVSFNYKNQLEDFFKKVNAVQVSNDQLSQVKNRLEVVVEEVRSQNEELVKKDRLSQFELDKNRSRLQNLEREYEDLKARVQQQNQQ